MKKPKVDQSICEGHAVCVGIAPEVFVLDDKGKSTVKNPAGASMNTIQTAIDACPVQAISWTED